MPPGPHEARRPGTAAAPPARSGRADPDAGRRRASRPGRGSARTASERADRSTDTSEESGRTARQPPTGDRRGCGPRIVGAADSPDEDPRSVQPESTPAASRSRTRVGSWWKSTRPCEATVWSSVRSAPEYAVAALRRAAREKCHGLTATRTADPVRALDSRAGPAGPAPTSGRRGGAASPRGSTRAPGAGSWTMAPIRISDIADASLSRYSHRATAAASGPAPGGRRTRRRLRPPAPPRPRPQPALEAARAAAGSWTSIHSGSGSDSVAARARRRAAQGRSPGSGCSVADDMVPVCACIASEAMVRGRPSAASSSAAPSGARRGATCARGRAVRRRAGHRPARRTCSKSRSATSAISSRLVRPSEYPSVHSIAITASEALFPPIGRIQPPRTQLRLAVRAQVDVRRVVLEHVDDLGERGE